MLCERSKRLPGSSQDSPKNFTVKKLLQAKNWALPGRFLNRSRKLIGCYWEGNFGHVNIEVDWVIGREWICQCLASCNDRNSPANKAVCSVCVVCVVCTAYSLHFSMAVVVWMCMKAVYAIWNGFSANGFWIHSLEESWFPKAGFWIPIPSIPDFTSKNFLDSGIRITFHGAKFERDVSVFSCTFLFYMSKALTNTSEAQTERAT